MFEPPKATVSIYADIPFNHAEWKRHRNAAWRHRPQLALFARVAGGFWWQLTYTFVVSLLVGVYHHHIAPITTASSKLATAFNLTTFALSLLLVFRTNSSYSRWWEARTVWGSVVNLSRNFCRQSLLWLPAREARVAVRWMMAAPYLLKCHLRFNASVRENVSHILMPQELEWVLGWTHRPNAAATVMVNTVSAAKLDTNRELIMMELINLFIDNVGKCERIFKTPIPAAYTRHTSRYLMMYLTALPMVLWNSLGWWTPAAAVLITFLLLGTENIGVQIEEPFRVLPLDDMCRGIEATLREMERQHAKLAPQLTSWMADPAGLTRSSSESSLDSFQDGPADGPSDEAALRRFHHIPPPAPLAAAAAMVMRASFRRQSSMSVSHHSPAGGAGGAGGGVGIGGSSALPVLGGGHRTATGSGELSHHHLFPAGYTHGGGAVSPNYPPWGAGRDSRSGPAVAAAGDSGTSQGQHALDSHGQHGSVHFPHHIHHPHRNLPQNPLDLPAGAGGSGHLLTSPGSAAGAAGAGGGGSSSSAHGGGLGGLVAAAARGAVSRLSQEFHGAAGPGPSASANTSSHYYHQHGAAHTTSAAGAAAGGAAGGAKEKRSSGGGAKQESAPAQSSASPFAHHDQQQQHVQQRAAPGGEADGAGAAAAGAAGNGNSGGGATAADGGAGPSSHDKHV
ncbi:hypothetical protein HXX76_010533 [Chlamydomonas incerta]|uniref:Uncharacterized protein n=1 Tax=Chlamydomonas incerta TaxID=51695 RepID=A0A835VXZ4_CHLIN|nr:hypothetical protein HXX76_010533 [Chlamydomonas incerta]|eukprot:KAG2429749.1 hypothetical protein HXX76_010533 [Chlamydomonas incerta]